MLSPHCARRIIHVERLCRGFLSKHPTGKYACFAVFFTYSIHSALRSEPALTCSIVIKKAELNGSLLRNEPCPADAEASQRTDEVPVLSKKDERSVTDLERYIRRP